LADASSFHTLKWFRAYKARGADVLLVSLEPPRAELSGETRFLRPRTKSRPLNYLSALSRVKALVSEFGPELINAHMATGYGLLAALASRNEKIVVSLWGPDILQSPWKSPLHRKALHFVFARAHLIQTDARLADRILIEDFGVPEEKVFFMPYGLGPDLLERPLGEFISGPPWRLITHRKLEPIYAPRAVLEALSQLKARSVRFTMTFASGGSLERSVREEMASRGIPGEVTGWLPERELYNRLADSHIFISASLSDTTPVSLLEAMALGAFPVVSDLPANAEWVSDGLNGLLFNPTCPQELARKLEECFGRPELIRRARELNRAQVRQRACWDRDFDRFMEKVACLPPVPLRLSKRHRVLPWSYLR
jgi:glycosyltransferase involved in cell wall biosynthesis